MFASGWQPALGINRPPNWRHSAVDHARALAAQKTRERRPILIARRPEIDKLLAGLNLDQFPTEMRFEIQAVADRLWRESNRWKVRKSQGVFARRIDK